MEQVTKPVVKRPRRRVQLAFAYFGLVLFMIAYFARPEDWIPGLAAIPLAKITGILILVALVFSFSNIRWHMPQEIVYLALLVILLWLSSVFSSVWRGGAVTVMFDFSKVLPLVIVIYGAVRSINRLRWILFVEAVSVATIAIISIVNAHMPGGRLQGAISGMYGNSNDLALIIDLSLPICLALAVTAQSNWKRLAWTVAILTMVYAVFQTASRGGAIALVVVALVCLWQLGVKSRRFYLLFLVPVVVIVLLLFSGNGLRERFDQTYVNPSTNNNSTEASASAQQRKALLIQSLEITAQHPLFGVGPGNFQIVSGAWQVSHNSYTQISAEGGIPAFFLYVLIFRCGIANLRAIRKHPKAGKGIRVFSMALEASLAAYFVGSLFASLAYQLFPYCLVAYTSALRLVVQKLQKVSDLPSQSHPTPSPVEAIVWQ